MEHQKKYRSLSDLEQFIEPQPVRAVPPKDQHDGRGNTVCVQLDTYGRKGKSVTIVSGLQHNPTTMEEIGRIMKLPAASGRGI
jgi:translation initiation factor 1 (eIF-1/SUI1)